MSLTLASSHSLDCAARLLRPCHHLYHAPAPTVPALSCVVLHPENCTSLGACSTQDEPAFCGLASIAMVLNALSIDPKRPWKGSWRWFHEELLDCCLPLNKVAVEGVVLTQVGRG